MIARSPGPERSVARAPTRSRTRLPLVTTLVACSAIVLAFVVRVGGVPQPGLEAGERAGAPPSRSRADAGALRSTLDARGPVERVSLGESEATLSTPDESGASGMSSGGADAGAGLVEAALPTAGIAHPGEALLEVLVVEDDTGSPVRIRSVEAYRTEPRKTDGDTAFTVVPLEAEILDRDGGSVVLIRDARHLAGYRSVHVAVQPAGYARTAEWFEGAAMESLEQRVLRLPSGVVVTGRVVDEYGAPVPDVAVWVETWTSESGYPVNSFVETDIDGCFVIRGLRGDRCTLELSYESVIQIGDDPVLDLSSGSRLECPPFVVQRKARIDVVVRRVDGRVAAGVPVFVDHACGFIHASCGNALWSGPRHFTDAEGRLRLHLEGREQGADHVRWSIRAPCSKPVFVTVRPGDRKCVDVVVDAPAVVCGRVADGRPGTGRVLVTAYAMSPPVSPYGESMPAARVWADEQGRFVLDLPELGEYDVRAQVERDRQAASGPVERLWATPRCEQDVVLRLPDPQG